jgi:hypothetical protein
VLEVRKIAISSLRLMKSGQMTGRFNRDSLNAKDITHLSWILSPGMLLQKSGLENDGKNFV